MTFAQHPLSAAFPAMQADEYRSLMHSIGEIGVQNPITLLDGMVLDGWNRYKAATECCMDCPSKQLDDWIDPVVFVKAQNKDRRHLPLSAWALIEVSLQAWRPTGNISRGALSAPLTATVKQMAASAGVSERTIQQAKSIQTYAAPEIVEAVRRGEVGLPKAAAIAKLPISEQAAALHKPTPKPQLSPVVEPDAEEPPDYTELDATKDALSVISEENDRLNDRLAVAAFDATEEERSAAHDTLIALRADNKTLTATLRAVTLSRDSLMEENAQMKRQMAMQRKEIDKLRNNK